MSPTSSEISGVLPQAVVTHSETVARSWAVPLSPGGAPGEISFAQLLDSKQPGSAAPQPHPPAPAPRGPAQPSAWQQTRYLATAQVHKNHWQPGRMVLRDERDEPLRAPPGTSQAALLHGQTTPAQATDRAAQKDTRVESLDAHTAPRPPETAAAYAMPAPAKLGKPLPIEAFPRPQNDNGWGMHWIPTVASSPEVVDRFVREAREMGITWVVFLNEGTDLHRNEYLVRQLTANGIMPVMRVYTPGLSPIDGDLEALVRHYRQLGVEYFQLYNEPNLMEETGGQYPCVERYLDLWIPAARRVVAAGGLPGFGALSPMGEFDDREFLRQALEALRRRGDLDVLDRAWLSMHNYAGHLPVDHPDGFMRYQQYANILREQLGRLMPIVGTEAGTYVTGEVTEQRKVELVTATYRHMAERREPYNFAFTYWIIANKEGGGHDPQWEWQALFQRGGRVSPLVSALKEMAGRA